MPSLTRNLANRLPLASEYGGFILLNLFDLFLTVYIFNHGGHEVNPVGVYVMDRYGMPGFTLFKFALVAVVIVTVETVYRRRPKTGRNLIHSANLIYFGVVLWECVLIATRIR
jgi:hypothetical protein